jgi:GT2 family glycosyltransferase
MSEVAPKSAPVRARLAQVDLVVLLHRDAASVVARSIDALATSMGSDWAGRIVLVLNASPPSLVAAVTTELLRQFPRARITSVECRRNLGFAGGVNIGMTRTTAPYVGVFNPDGVTAPDTVAQLVAALEQEPVAFMAGARLVPSLDAELESPAGPRSTDWLPGTAALYRRDSFFALGGFDPGFFMYCEDVDLSRRVRAQGRELLFVPEALFQHARGFSRVESLRRIRMWTVSNSCLVYQYASPRRRALARLSRQRARWFRDLARARRLWTLAGAMLGSVTWVKSIPRLEYRRRHPWDRTAFASWLARSMSDVRITDVR